MCFVTENPFSKFNFSVLTVVILNWNLNIINKEKKLTNFSNGNASDCFICFLIMFVRLSVWRVLYRISFYRNRFSNKESCANSSQYSVSIHLIFNHKFYEPKEFSCWWFIYRHRKLTLFCFLHFSHSDEMSMVRGF